MQGVLSSLSGWRREEKKIYIYICIEKICTQIIVLSFEMFYCMEEHHSFILYKCGWELFILYICT